MKFEELLICAKLGDENARQTLLEMYRPMLVKASIINGSFDEDLYQELCVVLVRSIEKFVI